MASQYSSERREHKRLQAEVPVKIHSDDHDVVTETMNISCAGAYCRINKYIDPMTKLKIQLLLPFKKKDQTVTKKVSCQGVVVRTETISDYFHIAIFFNEIQKRDMDCIADYINSVQEVEQG